MAASWGRSPQKPIYQVPKPPGRGKYPNYVVSKMQKKSEIFFKKVLTRVYFLYILCIYQGARNSPRPKKEKNGMIKILQIESNSYALAYLFASSASKHYTCYVDTNSGRVVDCSELSFRFGVSNFSTAKKFFDQYEKIQAQAAAEYEKDLEIEMRTSF